MCVWKCRAQSPAPSTSPIAKSTTIARAHGSRSFSNAGSAKRLCPAPTLDLGKRHVVDAAASQRQVSVARRHHVAHDAAARGNSPGLKLLRRRIEAHQHV